MRRYARALGPARLQLRRRGRRYLGKPTINALISSTSGSRFDQAVLREFEEGYNLSRVTLGKPSKKSSIESPPRDSREAFGLAHACRKRRGRRLGSLGRRRLGVAFAKATSAARMRQLRGVTLEVTDRRFAEAQGVYRRVRLTVRVAAQPDISSGVNPICLAMRASIFGPISSLSWKANAKSGDWVCDVNPIAAQLPPNSQQGRIHVARPGRRPPGHAVATEIEIESGRASPCSSRSAITRSARNWALAIASSRVEP